MSLTVIYNLCPFHVQLIFAALKFNLFYEHSNRMNEATKHLCIRTRPAQPPLS